MHLCTNARRVTALSSAPTGPDGTMPDPSSMLNHLLGRFESRHRDETQNQERQTNDLKRKEAGGGNRRGDERGAHRTREHAPMLPQPQPEDRHAERPVGVRPLEPIVMRLLKRLARQL